MLELGRRGCLFAYLLCSDLERDLVLWDVTAAYAVLNVGQLNAGRSDGGASHLVEALDQGGDICVGEEDGVACEDALVA